MKKLLKFIARFSFWITIGTIVTMIGFLVLFLYNNLYRTITEAEMIVSLRSLYPVEPVATKSFEAVKKIIDEKQTRPRADWNAIRNPFGP